MTTATAALVPADRQSEIQAAVYAAHTFTRRYDSSGCAASVCSCGISSAPTNAKPHLGRWERSHRSAFVNDALLAEARAIRKAGH